MNIESKHESYPMSLNDVLHQLLLLEEAIKGEPRRPILSSTTWKDDVPHVGGVYVIWDKQTGNPVYVGETCHLNHRFIDLKTHHNFRRKAIDKHQFVDSPESSALSQKLSELYSLSFLPLYIGRKELEEFLNLKWRDDYGKLMNDLPGRLRLSENCYKLYKSESQKQ